VGSTSKPVRAMDATGSRGLCLYGTEETSSGLWTLTGSEEMSEKRGEEHTYVDVCLLINVKSHG
jgi:hypothetical protein